MSNFSKFVHSLRLVAKFKWLALRTFYIRHSWILTQAAYRRRLAVCVLRRKIRAITVIQIFRRLYFTRLAQSVDKACLNIQSVIRRKAAMQRLQDAVSANGTIQFLWRYCRKYSESTSFCLTGKRWRAAPKWYASAWPFCLNFLARLLSVIYLIENACQLIQSRWGKYRLQPDVQHRLLEKAK